MNTSGLPAALAISGTRRILWLECRSGECLQAALAKDDWPRPQRDPQKVTERDKAQNHRTYFAGRDVSGSRRSDPRMRRSFFSVLLASLATLYLLLFATSDLHGQSFNLQAEREPVASLDGLWRFHTGDNPAWADPNFDDSQWTLVRSDEPWDQQGYKNYGGFAWYRFTVAVPEGNRNWSIYLGPMETGYQFFVDGHLAGSFGPILNSRNYVLSSRAFAISPAAAGPRTFHIAIRAWHSPVWAGYALGGFYGSSYFGDSRFIAQRAATARSIQWNGLVDEYTYAVLCTVVGLVVLVLFFIRREEREYLWFALLLLANAIDIGLIISRQLALIPLPVFDFIDGSVQSAALLAALAFFSVVLRAPRSRTWWLVAALLFISPPAVFLYVFNISSVAIAGLLAALAVLPATVWILATLFKRALQRDRDALILLVPTLLWQGVPFINNILLITWQLGWQRWAVTWGFPLLTKPFVLMPGPAVGTIFIFALLLFLIRRFSLARQEETRLSSEFESARNIQSLLFPAKPRATPGFAIESVYLPASEVGGDFFQIMPANDGSLLVVVGDVSGKGLKAGMTVGAIIGALRGCAVREPAEVLAHLNYVLHGQITGFVTCTAALIAATGNMILANAGNLPPYCNGQELDVESGLPLGMTPDVCYSESTFQLNPNDRLTFVSDGVVEATNERGELFGFQRTQGISTQPASAIAEAAKRFGQRDDITVLTLTLTPSLAASLA
jgi:phosphoserine phosphatase RsbU/P